jgi:methyltransferase (TIGR00027 family)
MTDSFRRNAVSQSQPPEPLIPDISDTALRTAVIRARESDRADALFHDSFARRLAGERGERIASSNTAAEKMEWALVMRTYLYDQFITEQLQQGVDLVLNLGAGLDARPYRMALPATLKWIEVDLPGVLEYKEKILRHEKPACALERVRMDLSDVDGRRSLFERLASLGGKALVVTEGLLIYFSASEVGTLSRDLAGISAFQRWIVDLVSPGLLRSMQKQMSQQLAPAGAAFNFAPNEGPDFFIPFGWKPLDVRSPLKTAARFDRVPLLLRLIAALPASSQAQGRPWSGICLLGKTTADH